MIKKHNFRKASSVVFQIEILASQLRSLLQFAGQSIFPFNNKNNAPIFVEAEGQDKIRMTVGNHSAVATIPVEGEDTSLANGFKYKKRESGEFSIGLVPRRDNVYHPLRRELGRTSLHAGMVKELPEPKAVRVYAGERVKYFSEGNVLIDDTTECERRIAGAEWWIIYNFDANTEKVTITDIIGKFGGDYSDAAVEAFKKEMMDFLRQPTKAFNHLLNPKPAPKSMTKREARAKQAATARKSETSKSTVNKPAITETSFTPVKKTKTKVAFVPKDGRINNAFAEALKDFVPASKEPETKTIEEPTVTAAPEAETEEIVVAPAKTKKPATKKTATATSKSKTTKSETKKPATKKSKVPEIVVATAETKKRTKTTKTSPVATV